MSGVNNLIVISDENFKKFIIEAAAYIKSGGDVEALVLLPHALGLYVDFMAAAYGDVAVIAKSREVTTSEEPVAYQTALEVAALSWR